MIKTKKDASLEAETRAGKGTRSFPPAAILFALQYHCHVHAKPPKRTSEGELEADWSSASDDTLKSVLVDQLKIIDNLTSILENRGATEKFLFWAYRKASVALPLGQVRNESAELELARARCKGVAAELFKRNDFPFDPEVLKLYYYRVSPDPSLLCIEYNNSMYTAEMRVRVRGVEVLPIRTHCVDKK